MIKPDAFTEHYNSVYDQVKHLEQKPYGCLQWKGTNACIDVCRQECFIRYTKSMIARVQSMLDKHKSKGKSK